MAKKQSPAAEWFKKNWFFLFVLVPFMQWLPCFVMNGKARKKKWLIMGLFSIFIVVAAVFITSFADSWEGLSSLHYPDGPEEEDYRDFTYNDFRNSDGVIDWDSYYAKRDEWAKTDAYKEYMDALDEYYKSPEYIAVSEENTRRYSIRGGISSACGLGLVLKYILYVALILFIERYRYEDALVELENRKRGQRSTSRRKPSASTRKIQSDWQNISDNIVASTPKTTPAPFRSGPESYVVPDQIDGILNINTATEKQIEELPLIGVVDAKRIIEYRNTNGSFKTVDEFFNCFNARPHVIVKLQDRITVDTVVKSEVIKKDTTSKPRFDL